jgi:glycosyltransferase involved in cell wall biosynthesis
MLRDGVTAVICAIPDRKDDYLSEAIESVFDQTFPVSAIALSIDHERLGAAANRDRALDMVQTEWVAFLDDDDWWYPEHIQTLVDLANSSGADLVHPHYDVVGGEDPFPMFEGREFDLADPHQIPVTFMVKTEAIRSVGGFSNLGIIRDDDPGHVDSKSKGIRSGEDWRVTLHLAEAGYKFAHTPAHTWAWRHHESNTSGLPSRRPKHKKATRRDRAIPLGE